MTLESQFNINYNLKHIVRIMNKYDIICPHRKANPYRRMMKATKEHSTFQNLLNKEFKQEVPGKVLLTYIIHLFYKNGQNAYWSTFLDAYTNEMLAYNLSKNFKIDIVTNTIERLISSNKFLISLDTHLFIQIKEFIILALYFKKYNIGQSMSRRGTCWDNAPHESFFGHFKDETNIKNCNTFKELLKEFSNCMDYYNDYQDQGNLKKMTPVRYRNHLFSTAKRFFNYP